MDKKKFSEELISDDAKEKLKLENDILRLKLRAQTGGDLTMARGPLPPEVEHVLLKNVIAFEEGMANAKLISIVDYIGNPVFKAPEEITDMELEQSLARLIDLMLNKQLTIDFGTLKNNRERYTFLVEDLFSHKISDFQSDAMYFHFKYEEFHPDYEADIKEKAVEFITNWFERTMGKFSWELADEFILPDRPPMGKSEVLEKFKEVFNTYGAFRDCKYLFNDIGFEFSEDRANGLAHIGGVVNFKGIRNNGTVHEFNGPFKLFLSMEGYSWRIIYFVFPGFEW